jgi:hypothetical protein
MSGAIPPFPQYAFMAWCLVKWQDIVIIIVVMDPKGTVFNLLF